MNQHELFQEWIEAKDIELLGWQWHVIWCIYGKPVATGKSFLVKVLADFERWLSAENSQPNQEERG